MVSIVVVVVVAAAVVVGSSSGRGSSSRSRVGEEFNDGDMSTYSLPALVGAKN